MFSVLIFGDSHIERIRQSVYGANNIWDMKPRNVTCLGVPGLKAKQWPEYLGTILEMHPDLLIISLGGNDTSIHPRYPWLAHNSAAETYNELMTFQMILIQFEIPVMITSAIKRKHNNTIWELNKGLGRGLRERYISFSSFTRTKFDFLDDGVHLTELAYRHCFKEIIQSINSQKKMSHFFNFNQKFGNSFAFSVIFPTGYHKGTTCNQ